MMIIVCLLIFSQILLSSQSVLSNTPIQKQVIKSLSQPELGDYYAQGQLNLKSAEQFAAIGQSSKSFEQYMLSIKNFEKSSQGRKRFWFERLLDKPLKIAPSARKLITSKAEALRMCQQLELLGRLYDNWLHEPENTARALNLALSIVDEMKPVNKKAKVRISIELSLLYVRNKKFDDAAPVLEEALPLLRDSNNLNDLVLALELYEVVLQRQGKLRESETIQQERIPLSIKQGQQHHKQQVKTTKGGADESF